MTTKFRLFDPVRRCRQAVFFVVLATSLCVQVFSAMVSAPDFLQC
jgi:hypothetical protein